MIPISALLRPIELFQTEKAYSNRLTGQQHDTSLQFSQCKYFKEATTEQNVMKTLLDLSTETLSII